MYNAYDLTVTRFQWSCPQPGLLELRSEWCVSGTPAPQPGRPVFATTQSPEALTEVTRHHYTFGQEAPLPGAKPCPHSCSRNTLTSPTCSREVNARSQSKTIPATTYFRTRRQSNNTPPADERDSEHRVDIPHWEAR